MSAHHTGKAPAVNGRSAGTSGCESRAVAAHPRQVEWEEIHCDVFVRSHAQDVTASCGESAIIDTVRRKPARS